MMNKDIHKKNAFHFSCWGSHVKVAGRNELGRDRRGFSLVGGDGKLHDGPVAYYESEFTIPTVVPDGVYVLGWVWYGGVGGSLQTNTVETPHAKGLFADYWSCAFVEIKGGAELQAKYTPVFKTGMNGPWAKACNSMNDRPGVCRYEPCVTKAEFMQPQEFKDGAIPPDLTQANFQSASTDFTVPTPVPDADMIGSVLEALDKCEAHLGKSVAERGKLTTLKKALVSLYHCKRLLEKAEEANEESPLFDEAGQLMAPVDEDSFRDFLESV